MSVMLVTGANRGLGLEFARQYAAEGWRVHATCRHLDEAGELRAIPGEVAIHRLDVRDRAAYPDLAQALGSEAIDLLSPTPASAGRPVASTLSTSRAGARRSR